MIDLRAQSALPAADTSADALGAAYRQSLVELQNRLTAVGASPGAIEALAVHSPGALIEPAAWHYERLFREVFGGIRPRFSVEASEAGVVAIHARVRPAPPRAESRPVWRGQTPAELARAYSARAAVPEHLEIFRRWRLEGARFLADHRVQRDLAYGARPGQRLDLFPAERPGAPLHLFIHGGYWQAMDKEDHCQLLRAHLEAGWAVAVINYSLCPTATVAEQIDETRQALRYLWRQADTHGYDRQRIQVGGHSAGAQLGAWLLATDWPALDPAMPANPIHSAILVSGLFDLEPVSYLPFAAMLGVDDLKQAWACSPIHAKPAPDSQILLALGGAESEEFHWQTIAMADAWRPQVARLETLDLASKHHFSVIETLADGALAERALAMMG